MSHVDDVRWRVAMSIVVPKGRKYLCADALFRLLREHFATIVEDRGDEVEIPLSAAWMTAFARFSLTAPSLLAFDKQRADGNLQTIYGITHTPCDTRMRERLDPVSPESLRPSFTLVFRQLQRGKALCAVPYSERSGPNWVASAYCGSACGRCSMAVTSSR